MKFEDQKSWIRVGAMYKQEFGFNILMHDDVCKGAKMYAFKNEHKQRPTSPDYVVYVKSLLDGVIK